jgi:hypothetical protein
MAAGLEELMELTWFAGSALIGGVLIASLMILSDRRRSVRHPHDAFAKGEEARTTDVINIASIRVAGIGGLGLVAMAFLLALAIPRIGQSLALGAILGVGFALALILWRRRFGPIPTSGGRMGANTALSIDEPVDPGEGSRKVRNARRHAAEASGHNVSRWTHQH